MADSLRATMAGALQARREERGLSLEALARRTTLTKPGIHGIEVGRTGEFLDRLDEIASALGARWSVALLPADEADVQREALEDLLQIPRDQLPVLRALLRAWPALTEDDRAIVAMLCARRQRPAAEVLPLTELVNPGPEIARRQR